MVLVARYLLELLIVLIWVRYVTVVMLGNIGEKVGRGCVIYPFILLVVLKGVGYRQRSRNPESPNQLSGLVLKSVAFLGISTRQRRGHITPAQHFPIQRDRLANSHLSPQLLPKFSPSSVALPRSSTSQYYGCVTLIQQFPALRDRSGTVE